MKITHFIDYLGYVNRTEEKKTLITVDWHTLLQRKQTEKKETLPGVYDNVNTQKSEYETKMSNSLLSHLERVSFGYQFG